MRSLFQLLYLKLVLGVFLGCTNTANNRVLRLGHGLDVTHSVHLAMLHIDETLQELSEGKMRLQIYPNQQLGSERECLELLQIGSLDMTKVSAAVMENFVPQLRIYSLPFLFENKNHYYKTLDGSTGKALLNKGERYWLKGLAYYDSGSRSFYSREKPIALPDDLNGMKIRVMESVSAMQMIRELGGSPTPISWGELYTALQQGVVDAAENNPPSFYLSRHYEVCKYYSIDEHTMIPDMLMISTHSWNRLNKNEQDWLMEAVKRSVPYQRELWVKSENEALNAVIEAGVQVTYPDKKSFQKRTKVLYEAFGEKPEMAQLIQKIQNEKP